MMHQRLGILLLLTALFSVTSVNSGRACNDISKYHVGLVSEKNTEQAMYEEDLDNCTQVFDDCTLAHPGQDCPPDSDGCGHCHCPGCGSIFNMLVVHTAFSPCVCHNLTFSAALNRQAFYFAKYVPERPYLPIWQPPQIRA